MAIESVELWTCDFCHRQEHRKCNQKAWIHREIPDHFEPNQDREIVICPTCQLLLKPQPKPCPKTPPSATS